MEFFISGFRDGLRIPWIPRICTRFGNFVRLPGKEVRLGRMDGPFEFPLWRDLRVPPLGAVPKRELVKFSLIHYLSYPKGSSVNDRIDELLSSISYTSLHEAVNFVKHGGRGTLLAKVDIESDFHLLAVYPDFLHLLHGCYEGCF